MTDLSASISIRKVSWWSSGSSVMGSVAIMRRARQPRMNYSRSGKRDRRYKSTDASVSQGNTLPSQRARQDPHIAASIPSGLDNLPPRIRLLEPTMIGQLLLIRHDLCGGEPPEGRTDEWHRP